VQLYPHCTMHIKHPLFAVKLPSSQPSDGALKPSPHTTAVLTCRGAGVDGPDGAGVVNASVVIANDVLVLAPAVLLEAAGVLVPTDTVLLEVAGDGVVEVPMAIDNVSASVDDDAVMLLVEAAGASIDVLEGIGDVIAPPLPLDDATVLLPIIGDDDDEMLFIVEVLPIIGADMDEMPVVLDSTVAVLEITVAEDANVLLIGETGAGVVVLGALVILEDVTAPCKVPTADDDDKLPPMGVLDDPGVDGPDGAGVVNASVVIANDVLVLAPCFLKLPVYSCRQTRCYPK